MDESDGGSISRAGSEQDESVTKLLSIPLAPMNVRYAASLTRPRFLPRNKAGARELNSRSGQPQAFAVGGAGAVCIEQKISEVWCAEMIARRTSKGSRSDAQGSVSTRLCAVFNPEMAPQSSPSGTWS